MESKELEILDDVIWHRVIEGSRMILDVKEELEKRYSNLLKKIENPWLRYEIARKASDLANSEPKKLAYYLDVLEKNVETINRIAKEAFYVNEKERLDIMAVEEVARSFVEVAATDPKDFDAYLELLEKIPKEFRGIFAEGAYYLLMKDEYGLEGYIKAFEKNLWKLVVIAEKARNKKIVMEGAVLSARASGKALETYLEVLEGVDTDYISYIGEKMTENLRLLLNYGKEKVEKFVEILKGLRTIGARERFLSYTRKVLKENPSKIDSYLSGVSSYIDEINKLNDYLLTGAAMKAAVYGVLDIYLDVLKSLKSKGAKLEVAERVLNIKDVETYLRSIYSILDYEKKK